METQSSSANRQSVSEIRAQMPADRHRRSTPKALALVLFNLTLYLASFLGAIFAPSWPLKIICASLNSILIATLFIVGHDACHGSLTASHRLNEVLGRLAFLPALQPYIAWELGHNRLHHGWTNLSDKDYGYTPLSKAQFDALPTYRRNLERLYRTVWGVGFYYLIEVWWKHMMVPRPAEKAKMNRRTFQCDLLLVIVFALAQIAAVGVLAVYFTLPAPTWLLVTVAVVWPFLLWNWIMAFVTFQHHTHPSVTWYADRDEWSFFHGQVQGTVHVTFSRPIELVFHNILEHTAHHVDPKIPLYNLRASQQSLEQAYAEDVISQKGSILQFHRVLSKCKLYDYSNYQWLDFDGRPTSEPTITAIEKIAARRVSALSGEKNAM